MGGTGIDPANAITIWATVITIVFIVFSVLGIMNIDGKIREIDDNKKVFKAIEEKSADLMRTLESSRNDIIKKAHDEIQKIIKNSSEIQNYYQMFAAVEAEPAPDKRIALYTDLISKTRPVEGLDKAFPYFKRGAAYMMIGLLDKAKADFDFALENCSENNKSTAYGCIGDYYVRMEDYAKSIEYYKKALEKSPTSAPFCMDLGNSYNALQQYDKAQQYYDRALAINPESALIYYNKAKRLQDTIPNPDDAQRDQMLAYLEKSISLNPIFFRSYINKAAILRSQGKESDASEVLNQIVKPMFDPDFIMGIEQRGITYRLTGELPKALNDFNFVLFYEPHNIQNLSNLAMISLQMNNLGNADYYARIGLQEAEKQDNHTCDGDFYLVQQTLVNIQNQMRFPFGMDSVASPTPNPAAKESGTDNPKPQE